MGVLNVRLPGGPWIPITGVGTNPGLTEPQADARYVNISGDTMTGQLTVNRGPAQLCVALVGDASYIGYYDNSGNTRRGYIQGNSNGMYISSDAGDLGLTSSTGRVVFPANINVGTPSAYGGAYGGLNWSNGQYLIMSDGTNSFVTAPGAGATLYLRAGANDGNHSISISSTLVNVTGDLNTQWIYCTGYLVIGNSGGWNERVGWYNNGDNQWVRSLNDKGIYTPGQMQAGNMQCNGDMNISGTWTHVNYLDTRGPSGKITSNGSDGNGWGNKGFVAQVGAGSRAGYAIHPGGVAKQFTCATNDGGTFLHNEDGGWYGDLWVNTINQASSRRGKQDVASWPPKSAGAAVMDACNRLSLIDVVSYRIKPEMALLQSETMELHDCEAEQEFPCGGTHENPCNRVKDQQNPHIGIIIEDLATVLPEAVALDLEGNPGGMRTGTMIGYLLAVCKEQQQRIEQLEHHLEAA
jgi:Bacterial shufflon protein, N-terminal constant region